MVDGDAYWIRLHSDPYDDGPDWYGKTSGATQSSSLTEEVKEPMEEPTPLRVRASEEENEPPSPKREALKKAKAAGIPAGMRTGATYRKMVSFPFQRSRLENVVGECIRNAPIGRLDPYFQRQPVSLEAKSPAPSHNEEGIANSRRPFAAVNLSRGGTMMTLSERDRAGLYFHFYNGRGPDFALPAHAAYQAYRRLEKLGFEKTEVGPHEPVYPWNNPPVATGPEDRFNLWNNSKEHLHHALGHIESLAPEKRERMEGHLRSAMEALERLGRETHLELRVKRPLATIFTKLKQRGDQPLPYQQAYAQLVPDSVFYKEIPIDREAKIPDISNTDLDYPLKLLMPPGQCVRTEPGGPGAMPPIELLHLREHYRQREPGGALNDAWEPWEFKTVLSTWERVCRWAGPYPWPGNGIHRVIYRIKDSVGESTGPGPLPRLVYADHAWELKQILAIHGCQSEDGPLFALISLAGWTGLRSKCWVPVNTLFPHCVTDLCEFLTKNIHVDLGREATEPFNRAIAIARSHWTLWPQGTGLWNNIPTSKGTLELYPSPGLPAPWIFFEKFWDLTQQPTPLLPF